MFGVQGYGVQRCREWVEYQNRDMRQELDFNEVVYELRGLNVIVKVIESYQDFN